MGVLSPHLWPCCLHLPIQDQNRVCVMWYLTCFHCSPASFFSLLHFYEKLYKACSSIRALSNKWITPMHDLPHQTSHPTAPGQPDGLITSQAFPFECEWSSSLSWGNEHWQEFSVFVNISLLLWRGCFFHSSYQMKIAILPAHHVNLIAFQNLCPT